MPEEQEGQHTTSIRCATSIDREPPVVVRVTAQQSICQYSHPKKGPVRCDTTTKIILTNVPAFETMSKRRRGYPSETQVKRGKRIVHGEKLLEEKLGRNDLCPCGSHKRFKKCCLKKGRF